MSLVENFLSPEDEQEIVDAIRIAEKDTSGEIRVHIESSSNIAHFKRAQEVFQKLKMHNTKESNGVLIYIAALDCKFVIIGDKGIHNKVSTSFWDVTRDVMQEYFKKGDFKNGIIQGVLKTGNELKSYFPWNIDDEDELSNEISKS